MTADRRQQIARAHQQASASSPEDRRAILLALDPDLRHEVEAMLAGEATAETASMAAPILPGPGFQFAHYRIDMKLGEGGMGSVYRATDTKLGRPIAIKLLSDDFADSAGRRRFQQEARTASSLNHPHIVTVHDAGEMGGRHYLVTEYVEGGTLKDWAAKDRRSWKEVVEMMTGVGDALAAAHQAGIVHRDIKPANILVAQHGYAKLADFGLAKLVVANPAPSAESPGSDGLTKPGMIVGTVAYMSPEQASGRPVDARSDIFSFGVVLYELLAGRHPFAASNEFELLKTIIHDGAQPLPNEIPAGLVSCVQKAMEKDPADRYQAMRDLVVDLKRLGRKQEQDGPAPAMAEPLVSPAARGRKWAWAVLGAAAVITIAVGLFTRFRNGGTALETLLANANYTRITDWDGSEEDAAISRDGRFVAFRGDRDGPMDTWITQIGTSRFRNVTLGKRSSVIVRNVGFTADGSEIWLSSMLGGDRMRLVPILGGTARPFLTEHTINVSWSPDGSKIVFHLFDPGDETFIADNNGDNARSIFKSAPDIHNHFPTWSRDGQWIYFVRGVWNARDMDVWRIPSQGGTPERLTSHHADVRYLVARDNRTLLYTSPDEHGAGPWLWALDTETRAAKRISSGLEVYSSVDVSGDGKRLVVSIGKPSASLWTVPILDGVAAEKDVQAFPTPSARAFAPRYGGESLYYLSASGGGDGLWRLDNEQAVEVWKGASGSLLEPAAPSFDGLRVAVILRKQGKRTLHTISPDGGDIQPIAPSVDVTSTAAWSPDRKWIAAAGIDETGSGLFTIAADGGEVQRIMTGAAANPVWSPDASVIVYTGPVSGPVGPLLAIRPDGSPVDIPGIQVRVGTEHYRFVPGSQKLIYVPTVSQIVPENLWMLDLTSKQMRRIGDFEVRECRTFDVTPDGTRIVFDRLRQNADVVLIDLAQSTD